MEEGWLTITIIFHPLSNSDGSSYYSKLKITISYASKIKVQIVSNQASSSNTNFESQYATIIRMVSFESDKNEGSQIKSRKKRCTTKLLLQMLSVVVINGPPKCKQRKTDVL